MTGTETICKGVECSHTSRLMRWTHFLWNCPTTQTVWKSLIHHWNLNTHFNSLQEDIFMETDTKQWKRIWFSHSTEKPETMSIPQYKSLTKHIKKYGLYSQEP